MATQTKEPRKVDVAIIHECENIPLEDFAIWRNPEKVLANTAGSARVNFGKRKNKARSSAFLILYDFGFTGPGNNNEITGIKIVINAQADNRDVAFFDYVTLTKNVRRRMNICSNRGSTKKKIPNPFGDVSYGEAIANSLSHWRADLHGKEVKKRRFGVILRVSSLVTTPVEVLVKSLRMTLEY